MAINPSRIVEGVFQPLGLRAANAPDWKAAGIDAVTDQAVRAIFTQVGRAIGTAGITNRAVIFQILCVLLAKLGEYPIAGKLIAEIIDDMNLPWLEFGVRAIHGAGVGLHETLDRNGSNQFDVSEMLMPHLPSDVQEEFQINNHMSRKEALEFIAKLTPGVMNKLQLLENLCAVDKSDELEDNTEGIMVLLVRTIRVCPEVLDELPTNLTSEDYEAVSQLLISADAARHAADGEPLEKAFDDLREKQLVARGTLKKFGGFLLTCQAISRPIGLWSVSIDLKDTVLNKFDDLNTLERRIRAQRLAVKGAALGLAAGKAMVWNFWVLTMLLLTAVGTTLFGFLGRRMVYGAALPHILWKAYWLPIGFAGLLTIIITAIISMNLKRFQWNLFAMGYSTVIATAIIFFGWKPLVEAAGTVVGETATETLLNSHTPWVMSLWLGGLLSLVTFGYGAMLIEPIMTLLRGTINKVFGPAGLARQVAVRLGFLNETIDATRDRLVTLVNSRGILGAKVTGRWLGYITVFLCGVDLPLTLIENAYIKSELIDKAAEVVYLSAFPFLGGLLVWLLIAVGFMVSGRHNLRDDAELKPLKDDAWKFYGWAKTGALVLIATTILFPLLHGTWTYGTMKFSEISATWETMADCEKLGEDHPKFIECSTQVTALAENKTSWETSEDCEQLDSSSPKFIECSTRVAALADTRAFEARKQLQRLDEMGLLDVDEDEGDTLPDTKKSKAKASK